MYNWSVIHGIKRKPHLSVVWNWYHFVAIAILHQPRPTDSADINTRLQLSDTSSIPLMHGGFLLVSADSYEEIIISITTFNAIIIVNDGSHGESNRCDLRNKAYLIWIGSYTYYFTSKNRYSNMPNPSGKTCIILIIHYRILQCILYMKICFLHVISMELSWSIYSTSIMYVWSL